MSQLNTVNKDILINEDVKAVMKNRGIKEDDIGQVLEYVSETGKYLYSTDKVMRLGKKRLGNFTVYTEYKTDEDGFELTDTYSHRMSLTEDQNQE